MKKNFKFIMLALLSITCNYSIGQSTSVSPTNTYCGGCYLGWNGFTVSPLLIANQGTNNIVYQLGGLPSGQLDQSITGNTSFGYQTLSSLTTGAAITLIGNYSGFSNTSGYGNSFYGHSSGYHNTTGVHNTFLGDSAGYNNIGDDGKSNTFVGFTAGFSNLDAKRCTFLGDSSGYNNTHGRWNTFTGYACGLANDIGEANAFYGKHCAFNNLSGSYNSIFGTYCAATNTTGDSNCYMGVNCALWSNGHGNVGLGFNAGYNNSGFGDCYMGTFASYYGSGDLNTYIGYATQYTGLTSSTSFTNTTALGANAVVQSDNTMILGDNHVNVGMGLSNDNIYFGPRDRLEINLGLYNLINPADYGFDEPPTNDANFYSGLQFRDLTSWNTPTDNRTCNPDSGTGTCAVLSVDPHGRVILVKENIGAAIGYCSTVGPISLTDNAALNLDEWNYNYMVPTVPTTQNNSVGIGYDICNPTLLATLDVRNYTQPIPSVSDYTHQYAGKFYQTGYYNALMGTDDMVGVYGKSDVNSPLETSFVDNIGGDFYATKASWHNIGARGTADGGQITQSNIGLEGNGNNNEYCYGVVGNANGNSFTTGVKGFASSKRAIGIDGSAFGNNTAAVKGGNFIGTGGTTTYGIQTLAQNGSLNGLTYYGVDATANGLPVIPGAKNYGVLGTALGPNVAGAFNCGVKGYTPYPAAAPPISINYAVYGDLGPNYCINPYPIPCPIMLPINANAAGYFNGDLVSTSALWVSSDANLKDSIQDLSHPMSILNQLHPKSYIFNLSQNESMMLQHGTHFGLLAQDLQNVLPQLTKDIVHPARYDSLDNEIFPAINFKAVNYVEIIPYLIGAAKQHDSTINNQDSVIHSLQDQINNLTTIINNCCNAQQQAPPQNKDGGNNIGNGGLGNEKKLENGNIHAMELSNASGSPIIYQNIPNPFNSGGTKIRYFVPDNTSNPQIVFFDEFGGKLSTFNILETGMGELDVTASNLSSGVYSYSLIINGKAIDTKKMIFQK